MPADASALQKALLAWRERALLEIAAETSRLAGQDPQTPRSREPAVAGRTGGPPRRLWQSFRPSGRVTPGPVTRTEVWNTAPQALYTEKGTRAHGPVRARVLRFTTQGRVVFTPWVRGVAPQRWWRPVMTRSFAKAAPVGARRARLR